MRLSMLVLLGAILCVSLGWVCLAPGGYASQDRERIMAPSSVTHPAGTDELGRDRAVRTGAAVLLGFCGACAASFVASTLALLLGGCAAVSPGSIRRAMLYGCDLFFTLPWIFVLMLVRSSLPLSTPALQTGVVTFLLLAVLGAPAFLRVNQERTAALLRSDWVLQAYASGTRRRQLIRQLLPHLRPLFWTQFLLYVPACLIAEANLGALGLGMGEPAPSWGTMLAGLQSAAMVSNSHLIYLPMAVLVLVLVALELIVCEVRQ